MSTTSQAAKRATYVLRLPAETYAQVKAIAAAERRSIAETIRIAVDELIERHQEQRR